MPVQSSTKDDLFNLDLIRSYVDKELNPRFVERDWLKRQVEGKLADPDCRFVLLTAEPGAGKSAFMAWLANQHPDWCRYFIRRDQRTPLGDVGSYSFLLQVGFQLAATYPDLFKQEQIRIVVEQRIGTATNSEIVGADIGKMFASPFYEKIIQIQQQVTHSKDTNVTGVRIGEFYATERDLPIENLQFMALFDPAKAMMKQMQEAVDHPQQQIVVLVDALDELRYQDSELSLLKWLTNCPELPANLRFVLTCRPDDDLLRAFRGSQQGRIQEISIAEEDPDVEKDLTLYTRYLIEMPEVNQTLIEMHQDSDAFTRQAITKANGNFGYLGAVGRAVDEAIRQNEQQLLREILKLSELPDTLQDLYAFFLGKIKDAVTKEKVPVEDAEGEIGFVPVWSAVYKPILNILSVALEPLTPTQIQKLGLIQAEFDYVTGAIEKLQQFLDQLGNCYRLYHSTLPEFFTSPKTQEREDYTYCYVDAVKQNQRIVNYYRAGEKNWAEVDLEKIVEDDYGRRHLTQHLVKGDRIEELHTLLSLEKDGKNAWFSVKDSAGDTAGFLADVHLAWELVEKTWTKATLPNVIEKQCRYALIASSLKSISDIPTELLEALVKAGRSYGWSLEKGLGYVRQIPDPRKRARSLTILANYAAESQKERLWQEAITTGQGIQDPCDQAQVLITIGEKFSEAYKEALIVVQDIEIEYRRADVLSALATKLPQSSYKEALTIVQTFQDESKRADVLRALAPNLSQELYQEALNIARSIQDESKLVEALRALAPNLPQEVNSEALNIAQSIQDESKRADVLCALAPNLPQELYQEALNITRSIQDELQRAEALRALALKFPEVYSEALTGVLAIQDESTRAYHLRLLAENLPKELHPQALAAAKAIQYGSYSADILIALATHLPKELYPEALAAVQTIQDDSSRAKALISLAANFPQEFYSEAIAAAQTIWDESDRAKVLHVLIKNLPQELHSEIISAARAFGYENKGASVLCALAAKFPKAYQDLYREALATAQAFHGSYAHADFLKTLAANLPQELYKATLDSALAIEEGDRASVLGVLAANVPQAFYKDTLNAVLVIQDEMNRAEALSTLAANFPEALPEALTAAENIQEQYEYSRANMLCGLAVNRPEAFPAALAAAKAIKITFLRAKTLNTLATNFPQTFKEAFTATLASLADNKGSDSDIRNLFSSVMSLLPQELYQEALNTIQTIESYSFKSFALGELVKTLPQEFYKEIFSAAQASQCSDHVGHLIALAENIPQELYQDILAIAQQTRDGSGRALILSTLAVSFPEVCQGILTAVQVIQNHYQRDLLHYYRDEALNTIATNLPKEFYKEAFAAALAVHDPFKRAIVLNNLGKNFPEAYKEAFAATLAIQYEPSRAEALSALAEHLPQELYKAAFAAALEICDESARAKVLTALVKYLPQELFKEAFTAALALQFENRKSVLIALAAHISREMHKEALLAALTIEDEFYRACFLSALATNLPQGLYQETLNAALAIQGESYRADVLIALTTNLPQDLYEKTLKAALVIREEYYRAKVLIALGKNFPEANQQALTLAKAIQNEPTRDDVLVSLVANLSHQEALAVVLTLSYDPKRAKVLISLAANLPRALYREVLATVRAIQDKFICLDILFAIAEKFPEAYQEALNVVNDILDTSAVPSSSVSSDFTRAQVLITSAAKFPEAYKEEAYEKALKAVQIIQHESTLSKLLIELAVNSPQRLYQAILDAARVIQYERDYVEVLVTLAANLPQELYEGVLNTALTIQDEYYRAKALSALAANLPRELHKKIHTAALDFQSVDSRAKVLVALSTNFPEVCEEALAATLAISFVSDRAHVLLDLGINFSEAYEKIVAIAPTSYPNHTLERIAANLPQEFYREACTAALTIDNESTRKDTLSNLILRFSNLPISEQFTIWQTILHVGSQRKRSEFFSDLAVTVPLIEKLGGRVAGFAVTEVILQVVRWWQ